jgi:hypothetical protein
MLSRFPPRWQNPAVDDEHEKHIIYEELTEDTEDRMQSKLAEPLKSALVPDDHHSANLADKSPQHIGNFNDEDKEEQSTPLAEAEPDPDQDMQEAQAIEVQQRRDDDEEIPMTVDSEDERMNSNENEETQEEEATSNMVCF